MASGSRFVPASQPLIAAARAALEFVRTLSTKRALRGRVSLAAFQLAMVALANYVAFSIRFDGSLPDTARQTFLAGLPLVLALRGVTFYKLRLFGGVWRYSGTWDLRNLVVAAGLSSGVLAVLLPVLIPGYPRSIMIMDGILSVFLLGGLRLAVRTSRERGPGRGSKRVLIFGAGDAGAMVARDMRENPAHQMAPICFVDDDASKIGAYIHGVPVLGTRRDLRRLIERFRPDEILIAVPRLPTDSLRQLLLEMDGLEPAVRILPTFANMLDRRRELLETARPVAIEDLLRRTPAKLDPSRVLELVRGKRVLVTGAGGSIGSELCRQISTLGPATLVMVDRYENGLFEIDQSLRAQALAVQRFPVIADVTDRPRIEQVFATHQPELVFHAAAHKHVPLMECNSSEAVKNNVLGTRIVAEVAAAAGVDRFVLVSTDKAVNPSSVMGATKRIAEMLVQSLVAPEGPSVFAAVRFGNVLGSNGSVVPLFLKQIANGGPVTVTHPEMRRFFMLIPEAVQLLLHAAARASQGDIYVLDMGEQVKVTDMARALIKLSGPDREGREIPIEFIGMRPGEKLYEELVDDDEMLERSSPLDPIGRIRAHSERSASEIAELIARLESAANAGDEVRITAILRQLVPTFRLVPPAASVVASGDDARDAARREQVRQLPSPDGQPEPVFEVV
jgi:FlaA1/EpsC-like NDP-sugar epimerase